MAPKRIGLIGFGGIANGVHLPGYAAIPEEAVITAVCDINESKLQAAKQKLHLPESALFARYEDLLDSGLVDAVDICTSNDAHCPIALAAIARGIPFSVEKPLGLNLAEAKEVYAKANAASVPSFICFSWRYRAYTRYVRDLIKNGALGKLYHIYVRCIKDSGLWEGRRLEWRFDKEKAGTGVLGDLGSHMIDIVRFWGEEVTGVFATSGIWVTERQKLDSDEIAPVTTDDWTNMILTTESGVPVTINVSRTATAIDDLIEFEAYGENGRITFRYDNGKYTINACTGEDKKTKTVRELTPPESYTANQSLSFVNMLNGREDEYTAHLDHGIACQKVLEAAEISAKTGNFVKIADLQ